MMYRLEVIEYPEGDEVGDSVVYAAAQIGRASCRERVSSPV